MPRSTRVPLLELVPVVLEYSPTLCRGSSRPRGRIARGARLFVSLLVFVNPSRGSRTTEPLGVLVSFSQAAVLPATAASGCTLSAALRLLLAAALNAALLDSRPRESKGSVATVTLALLACGAPLVRFALLCVRVTPVHLAEPSGCNPSGTHTTPQCAAMVSEAITQRVAMRRGVDALRACNLSASTAVSTSTVWWGYVWSARGLLAASASRASRGERGSLSGWVVGRGTDRRSGHPPYPLELFSIVRGHSPSNTSSLCLALRARNRLGTRCPSPGPICRTQKKSPSRGFSGAASSAAAFRTGCGILGRKALHRQSRCLNVDSCSCCGLQGRFAARL